MSLPLVFPENGKCFLKVSYLLNHETELLPKGFFLGFDELLIPTLDGRNQKALKLCDNKISAGDRIHILESDRYLTLSAPAFTYEYDKLTGMFTKMNFRGQELLNHPMSLNIWRAPTDNDRKLKLRWTEAFYDRTVVRAYHTSVQATDNRVQIHSDASISGISIQRILDVSLDWTVTGSGEITAAIHAKRNPLFPELPRFGLRLFLQNDLEHLSYCGLGPMENYMDKWQAAYHGLFHTTVSELHEDYIRPQENGAHGDCDFAVIESNTLRMTIIGESFSFNASHYTQEELTEKGHNFELLECDSTVLCLDYRHNGIGSASCGPALSEKYKLIDERIDFNIRMIPEAK